MKIGPGAVVPGYQFAGLSEAARWELDPPPESEIHWLEATPTFFGSLPLIRMEPKSAFGGSVVEVVVAGAGGVERERLHLKIGKDVLLREDGETDVADLNTVPQLRPLLGRFILKCHQVGGLDRSSLTLHFNRLPAMDLMYVPDPKCPSSATAVKLVIGEQIRVTPGADTEILQEQISNGLNEFVARSSNAEFSPGIFLRSSTADWDLKVRVGVSRAGLLKADSGFQHWRSMPIDDLDLAQVSLGDMLRVEFHVPPPTENGHLVAMLPGRGELLAGRSITRTLFEIPLHRWRDGFGIGSSGVVRIRGGEGWVDAACLVAGTPLEPFEPDSEPDAKVWWQQLTLDLERAVLVGDTDAADQLLKRCLNASIDPASTPSASDLLPLAAAKAALALLPPSDWAAVRAAVGRLQERNDLPESRILATSLDLRRGLRQTCPKVASLSHLEEVEARLPPIPEASLVRAECWYQMARSTLGPAPGCWQACMGWAGRHLEAGFPESGIAFSDALLLRDFARLLGGYDSAKEPIPAGVLAGHRAWIEAVRFAGSFLRKTWNGRSNTGIQIPLPTAVPSILHLEDAALIRVLMGIATGCGEPRGHWPLVAGLPEGYFNALPLLRARYARFNGDPTTDGEYTKALTAALSGTDDNLLDVVVSEHS